VAKGLGTYALAKGGRNCEGQVRWIVERSFAWLGRNRRLSKDYEYRVQTSELMIDVAATRLMLNRMAR